MQLVQAPQGQIVSGQIRFNSDKLGYDDNGNVLYSFPSLMEAHRHGFDFRLVSACCLGKRSSHKGLHWRFSSNA